MITAPTGPAGRRTLTLRGLLAVMVAVGALYVGSIAVYLVRRVGPPVVAVGEGADAVRSLLRDMVERQHALDRASDLAQRVVTQPATPANAPAQIRDLAGLGSVRADASPYARVPPELRVQLARADELMARLGNQLTEFAATLELGRAARARERVRVTDSLNSLAEQQLSAVIRLSTEDLVTRQRLLAGVLGEARTVFLAWAGVGIVLAAAVLLTGRRRIARPLIDIEQGLNRVAAGDLTAQVPVRFADEIGAVAAHFNQMTRVLQTRAEQQGRFAAAGELLAGVAHEVNNPLMAIAGHAENRLAEPDLGPEQREDLAQILRQAHRASKLLRGLLRFVGGEAEGHTVSDLNDVARAAVDLVSYRFPVDEITPVMELGTNLPRVSANPAQLEQVLVNLLSNALDALVAVAPPRRLTVRSWIEGGLVRCAVEDNGRGIPAEFTKQLFRPFATTKGKKGTGLGLYISRQILRGSGGDLVLGPAPPAGSVFVASLPAVAEPAPVKEAAPVAVAKSVPVAAAVAQRSLEGLRVLVVDDEEMVRRPVSRFLTRRGAQVHEAADGESALTLLERQPVDCIVADLRMPRLDGPGLRTRLVELYPDLAERMLFLSGDITQLTVQGTHGVALDRILMKPIALAKLEERLLALLAQV